MKNLLLFSTLTLLIVSCDVSDWDTERVHGNGDVQTNEFIIDDFFEAETNGVYNLFLIQDSTWKITVEAESNILPLIEIYKRGNRLIIENEDNYEFELNKPINITIHHKGLDKIALNGTGTINGVNKTDEMHFFISGYGNIDADIDCYELDASISGVGNIKLTGEATESHITISGNGTVDAENLLVEKSWNTISGVGTEYLNVSEELHYDISGVGNIFYWGNPVIINPRVSGTGKIEKKD